jgi:hypothetical protein
MAQGGGKKTAMIVLGALAAFGVLGCCSSCIVLGWFGNQRAQEDAAPFRPLVTACAGAPVAGTAAVGTRAGMVQAQAVDEDGDLAPYWLPTVQRSGSLAETERVVCRGALERFDAESCEYETGIVTGVMGGRNVIQRFGYRRTVRVVAASTGQTLAEHTFEGAPPAACPESAEFDTGGETQSYYGEAPEDDPIHQWIAEVAAGRAM